jgi:hypothetical protein
MFPLPMEFEVVLKNQNYGAIFNVVSPMTITLPSSKVTPLYERHNFADHTSFLRTSFFRMLLNGAEDASDYIIVSINRT